VAGCAADDAGRVAQLLQRVVQPVAGGHSRPADRGVIGGVLAEPHAGQHPHSLNEVDPVRKLLLDLAPVFECLLEFLLIDLDPFAAQPRQTVRRVQNLLPLVVGQWLAVECQFARKVQQTVHADLTRLLLPDSHLHFRTR
jgi:hypothetical protein